MKRLIVLLSIALISFQALAQDAYPETGWKASVRPLLMKIIGEKGTDGLLGAAPLPPGPG